MSKNLNKHKHVQSLSYTHTLWGVHPKINEQFQFHEYSQAPKGTHWVVFVWACDGMASFFLFQFQSGVEGITALVTHLWKVMPCSITLNSAERTWAPSNVCLHWGCVGLPVGMWGISVDLKLLRLPPTHAEEKTCCMFKYPLVLNMFPLFLYTSGTQWDKPWFTHSASCSHWHTILNTHTHISYHCQYISLGFKLSWEPANPTIVVVWLSPCVLSGLGERTLH